MIRPTRSLRVLATGFEPFDNRETNPSWQCLRPLASERVAGAELRLLELPVSRRDATRRLLDALAGDRFDALIMFGEAGGRAEVTPERVAINLDDFRIPDNTGAQPRNEAVVADGPVGYFSTLPLERMREALLAAHIAASLSNTAGTYVCNHVFYRVMHTIAGRHPAVPAGFVHLPFMDTQVEPGSETPSLPGATIRLAVRICIEQTVEAARAYAR